MAFADVLAKMERFNQIGEEMAAPDADFDALMDEMGKLQDAVSYTHLDVYKRQSVPWAHTCVPVGTPSIAPEKTPAASSRTGRSATTAPSR